MLLGMGHAVLARFSITVITTELRFSIDMLDPQLSTSVPAILQRCPTMELPHFLV